MSTCRSCGAKKQQGDKMSKREPDGYCAWHKDRGWNLMSLNQVSEDTARLMQCDEEHGGEDYGCDHLDDAWERAVEDGWEIKRVYLHTEPPINMCALGKLIEWAILMAEQHRRDLVTLNCDDSLNEILEELGYQNEREAGK